MRGLDTNIIVRYLNQDDQGQYEKARDYLEEVNTTGEACFINNVVLCEVIWVLKTAYKMSKPNMIHALEGFLKADLFEFESRAAVWSALEQYRIGKADFSDYLIGQINRVATCSETATLDTKLSNTEGFRLL